MKYYIYVLALGLLLALAASPALASGAAVNLSVPSSFPVSSVARATDSDGNPLSPGPGSVDFTHVNGALYVKVAAPSVSGSRLVSLDDDESGITFRNNTLVLPIYSGGARAGTLVATTDNLTAVDGGFFGAITGLELDPAELTAATDGMGFTAGAALLLGDLPASADYDLAFADNETVNEAIRQDLEASGLAPAGMTPVFGVSGSPAGAGAISDMIVTVAAVGDWGRRYGGGNATFYRFADGGLSRAPYRRLDAGNGSVAYQAVVPGAGQLVVVAPEPRDQPPAPGQAAGLDDIALLGGVLAALLIGLAYMVRRVTRR